MKGIFFFLILFPTIASLCNAQNYFEKSFLLPGTKQYGVSIKESNGNFYLTSLADDCGLCVSTEYLTQIDQNGNLIRNSIYSDGTTDEMVGELTPYKNGFIFPVVFDHFNSSSTVKQVKVHFVDSIGNPIWTTELSDTLHELSCLKLLVDSDNIITAFVNRVLTREILLFRIDSTSNILSISNFGAEPEFSEVVDFIYGDSCFIVLGLGVVNGINKTFFAKSDYNGNILDTVTYNNPSEIRGMKILKNNNGFFICGQTFDSLNHAQVNLINTDSLGNIIWNNKLTNNEINIATSFAVVRSNQIVITGKTIDSLNNFIMFVISTDISGNFLWKRNFCLPGPNGCFGSVGSFVIRSADSSIVVCGQIQYISTFPKLYVLKIDSNGIVNFISDNLINSPRPYISKIQNSDHYFVQNIVGKFNLRIFDLDGRLIAFKKNENENEFDLNLVAGIFLYSIETSNEIFNGRIVK